MFKNQGLFTSILCPNYPKCSIQSHCIYSHLPPTTLPTQKPSLLVPKATVPQKRPIEVQEVLKGEGKVRRMSESNQGSSIASGSKLVTKKISKPLVAVKAVPVVGPPKIIPTGSTHTAFSIRSKMLSLLYTEFLSNYSKLTNQVRAKSLASTDALQQELNCYNKSNKAIYKQAIISTVGRLKKRIVLKAEDCGTLEETAERIKIKEEKLLGKLSKERVKRFVADKATLLIYDYIITIPNGIGGNLPTEEGNIKKCDRCGVEFLVKGELNEENEVACAYHWGRMVTEKLGGIKTRVFSCCPGANTVPCVRGAHTFKDGTAELLHSRIGFVETKSLSSVVNAKKKKHEIVAMDCELVYTTSGMSVARLTVIDEQGTVILDQHIKPLGTVLDLITRFSGITEKDLMGVEKDLGQVREELGELIDEKTIIVGHGLENDLKAMRLIHLNVIDTAIIFPHPRGIGFRHALRALTRDILGKLIQADLGSMAGHDSLDDSRCALELLRFKVKQL